MRTPTVATVKALCGIYAHAETKKRKAIGRRALRISIAQHYLSDAEEDYLHVFLDYHSNGTWSVNGFGVALLQLLAPKQMRSIIQGGTRVPQDAIELYVCLLTKYDLYYDFEQWGKCTYGASEFKWLYNVAWQFNLEHTTARRRILRSLRNLGYIEREKHGWYNWTQDFYREWAPMDYAEDRLDGKRLVTLKQAGDWDAFLAFECYLAESEKCGLYDLEPQKP